jgi:hypothetical protein
MKQLSFYVNDVLQKTSTCKTCDVIKCINTFKSLYPVNKYLIYVEVKNQNKQI